MRSKAEKRYREWVRFASEPAVADELKQIADDASAIEERFWNNLSFGTGGLRGIMGAGTTRMNIYTVGKCAQGVANHLMANAHAQICVCIGYDTRHMSYTFACHAASVLCANGIRVFLFSEARPTPMLSFMVRHKKAACGIVITASHNSKQYNGFKVYGSDGVQATDAMANAIQIETDRIDAFRDIKEIDLSTAEKGGQLVWLESDEESAYFERVEELGLRRELMHSCGSKIKILFTPLHGTGAMPVRHILDKLGFSDLEVLQSQANPDGDFTTVPYPNPEESAVYALAMARAIQSQPDLILATDPDCDRVGIMAKDTTGAYTLLTGNQVGVLLCGYILEAKKQLGALPCNAAVVKTIVSTDLAKNICASYDVDTVETLTGFKYIGELAERWCRSGEKHFIFGFEESCGYLSGDFVRDKDAVIACALIAEMALYYKTQGRFLQDVLKGLFEEHGYYAERLITIEKPGQRGHEEINATMRAIRQDYSMYFPEGEITFVEDYEASAWAGCSRYSNGVVSVAARNTLK